MHKIHPISTENFTCGSWKIVASKGHILKSEGDTRQRYDDELELPQFPEMIFGENTLTFVHESGCGISFNALDALKRVDAHDDTLKVAISEAWKESRKDCEHAQEVIKPFDWTYSTDYCGSLISGESSCFTVESTDEKINMEKLKEKEKIHFYADVLLFEDELADNGISIMNVKTRVMASGFLILLRQYVRVDNVIARLNDTRIYHAAETNYLLRDYTSKEGSLTNSEIPVHMLLDPNLIGEKLPVKEHFTEKLILPIS